jgi:hypothetical protein
MRYNSPYIEMKKHLLKAWLIGLAISLVGFALMAVMHTPLEAVGIILSIPGMLSLALVIDIGRRMALSDTAVGIASFISVPVFGSVFYGAIALIVLRLRERNKVRSG